MNEAPPVTDSRPAAQAPGGHASLGIRELADLHADFVWRSVRRLGVPAAGADDATQEVFVIASQKLDRIEVGCERAFLFGIAVNVAAHARRALARKREVPGDEETVAQADTSPSPEAALAKRQARALLDRALDSMDDELRAVFVLFELEEQTMAEIASVLAIPQGTVASRLRRARDAFHAAADRLRKAHERGGP